MNFKELKVAVTLIYCGYFMNPCHRTHEAWNFRWWVRNFDRTVGKQMSNYPNAGNWIGGLSNDLYKAGIRDEKLYAAIHKLEDQHIIAHPMSDGEEKALPKVEWA